MNASHDPGGPPMTVAELFAHFHEQAGTDPGVVRERMRRAGPIGNQLFLERSRAELTFEDLSKRSGVDAAHIEAIELGDADPTKGTLERLGVALGIDFVIGRSSAA